MPRDIQPVEHNKYGDDIHPAFGMLHVHRYANTPGAVLFDSDIRHGHTVGITLTTATRKRDLNRDWIHGDKEIVQIEMSEAQWAAFVSSGGSSGVPVTIRAVPTDHMVPGLEYDPRLAHSMDEVRGAAERTFGEIERAMEAYDALDSKATAKEKREALARIRNATRHARSNVAFASKSLTEHAENVVQRSRADIEAYAAQASQRLGLPESAEPLIQIEDSK